MIRANDNPTGREGLVKFVGSEAGEGHRGALLALSHDATSAIVLATTTSFDGERVRRGRLYLVREVDPSSYPERVDQVTEVPDDETFSLVVPAPSRP